MAPEANIAKLIGSQAASHAIGRSMQTMGGIGYAREFHVERLWLDAPCSKFAPVSEEMILNYIAIHGSWHAQVILSTQKRDADRPRPPPAQTIRHIHGDHPSCSI